MTSGHTESPGQRGFSLVELMVAVVILSIGILGSVGLIVAVTRSEMRTTTRIEMTEVAEGKIDQLRAAARSRTDDTLQLSLGGSQTESTANHSDTTQSGGGRWYIRRWEVEQGPGGTRTLHIRIDPRDSLIFRVPPVLVTTNLFLR